MLEKITKNFQNPKKKESFALNGEIYDHFLKNMFEKYEANSNNEQFYETLFTNLSGLSMSSGKTCSQLKYLCYELTNHLQKTSETINKLANLFNDMNSNEDAIYQKLLFKTDITVNDTKKRLVTGLNEWSTEILSVKKFVNDSMSSFFHYKKHENVELGTIMNYKIQITAQYKKKALELEKMKQKLFDAKDPTKWKIDMANLKEDFNDLYTSFQKIRPYMLPEVLLLGD